MERRIYFGLPIAASIAVLTIPTLVQAQTTRIEELQQRSRGTTVSGEVISVVGNDFVLNDGTGELIVDAGPTWWHDVDVEPGKQVTVTGEMSKKSQEFDAFSIVRADGSRMKIRPVDGPPPWAGRRDRSERGKPDRPEPSERGNLNRPERPSPRR